MKIFGFVYLSALLERQESPSILLTESADRWSAVDFGHNPVHVAEIQRTAGPDLQS